MFATMDTQTSGYANPYVVADSPVEERTTFIRRTYVHLAGAIGAFTLLEWFFLQQPWAESFSMMMLGKWLVVLLAFVGVSWVADYFAQRSVSKGAQYAGLALFVVAEAVIFLPLLYLAAFKVGGDVIPKAGILTGALFVGLTVVAFTTKKDFSFLGGMLKIGFIVAMGLILLSFIPGFPMNLGTWFSAAMVLLAAGSVLYTTSNILHHYRPDQYVGASLALFSAVALMFWYILRIFMSRR
jgi:FtsH-binding integral membrane protein